MEKSEFLVMILCHGQPDRVLTYDTMMKAEYPGDICIVCDDQDKAVEGYKKRFDDLVYVFDKAKAAENVDLADNFGGLTCTNIARNACYDIAEELGYEYFVVFDDDYNHFQYRFDHNKNYITRNVAMKNLYENWLSFVNFMKTDERIYSVCFAQGGDFIGGETGYFGQYINSKRKGMNSFFSSTKRRITYKCRFNDDITTSMLENKKGNIVITIGNISLLQPATQGKGGLTEVYVEAGTYVKSFYTVLAFPSSTKIGMMGNKYKRLHHRVDWKKTAPMIVSEKYKKG